MKHGRKEWLAAIAGARQGPTTQSLWRDAILDQLADAQCAIRDLMPDYAEECIQTALAMLRDERQGKPASDIIRHIAPP